jgi:predicted NBD/HSP70 family sugar kinase
MDYFAGLDISMDETQVCVVDLEGEVVRERKTESTAQSGRQTHQLQIMFRSHRWRRSRRRREVLSEPDAGNLHVRFDERVWKRSYG